MYIRSILILKNVPKLNFTVSHIIISAPLYKAKPYRLNDEELNSYYLHTRATSETFPLVILSDVELPSPCHDNDSEVYIVEGPFRVTVKNRKHRKFSWCIVENRECKYFNDIVEIFIRKAHEKDYNIEKSTKLVVSGHERYTMTHTSKYYYTLIKPAGKDLVLLNAHTTRRFDNTIRVFITRRPLSDILSSAEPPRYIPSPNQ